MASDPCAGLTGAELRHCLLLQYGAAVDGMCNGNLINYEEAGALKVVANGLAMKRIPDAANRESPLAGAADPRWGAA